jgi:hypothetical protein
VLKSGFGVAEVQGMINPEPSIKSQNREHDENPERDLLSPAIAIGGLLSTVAAQRVGEPAIRLFSTITGLLAAAFGASAFAVGRKTKQTAEAISKNVQAERIITLPSEEPTLDPISEVTVVLDLEKQPAPKLIDLSQSADELAGR